MTVAGYDDPRMFSSDSNSSNDPPLVHRKFNDLDLDSLDASLMI
jgi:hypothetical protein